MGPISEKKQNNLIDADPVKIYSFKSPSVRQHTNYLKTLSRQKGMFQ